MLKLFKIPMIISKGFIYDPAVFSSYLMSYFLGTKSLGLFIYKEDQTKAELINGKSIIRIGDGEAMLMTGRDIHYQKASLELKTKLRLIVDNYSNTSPFILGIPVDGALLSTSELKDKSRHRIWRLFRCFSAIRINVDIKYADAHSFYSQAFMESLLPALLKNKQVICITKNELCDETLYKYITKYANSVDFIPSKSEDAFSEFAEIKTKIDTVLHSRKSKPLLLLAAGPTSKVIAYEYSLQGIQSIDVGHGIEVIARNIDYINKI